MDIYVVYESRRGRARRAAGAVAEAAAGTGLGTLVRSVGQADPADALRAEAMVAGCWTRSDTPFGGVPVRRVVKWIEDLPDLHGIPVGVYCTYSFFPHTFADSTARAAEVLHLLTESFELKGGKVVASQPFHYRAFPDSASALVHKIVNHAA